MTLSPASKPYVFRTPATMPGELLADEPRPWVCCQGAELESPMTYFASWAEALAFALAVAGARAGLALLTSP